MIIPIQPVQAFPASGVALRVDDGRVDLGNGANFEWALLDANNNIVGGPDRNALTEEQYAAWNTDDSDVAKAVATNLGLVPVV